ncbi:uncharacterized protein LOC123548155 [Mercenaria mercenaria]|uniref:uncharacterized protein LOC123548155 n=1 Tax=Mercenaria mercenaria TaxID=6596 RepID=UPI00234E3A55|nr:uncharacterized protein LOC123548155 [Mercenaria mercenaria]
MYLQPNNVPLLEYVANLDSIPVRNTTIVLGSMKVRDGTGGPTRIFAMINEDDVTDSAGRLSPIVAFILPLLFILLARLDSKHQLTCITSAGSSGLQALARLDYKHRLGGIASSDSPGLQALACLDSKHRVTCIASTGSPGFEALARLDCKCRFAWITDAGLPGLLELRKIEFYEHQGTHIDAPSHFGNGRQSLEQIPPERLIGPGVVIDVRDKVKGNPDYAVTVDDILQHEREHGKIPPRAIVNMNSGWANKYPDARLVFGTDNITDPSTFHFPGWSPEACEMLLQDRQVNVVGVDTPSTDPAQPPVYPCHMYLQPNNVPLLEYVANLDSIPVRNTTIVLGAMKVRDGTGVPTRIFAMIDEDDVTDSAGRLSPTVAFILALLFIRHLI